MYGAGWLVVSPTATTAAAASAADAARAIPTLSSSTAVWALAASCRSLGFCCLATCRHAFLVSRVHVGRVSLVSKISLSCSVRRTWGDRRMAVAFCSLGPGEGRRWHVWGSSGASAPVHSFFLGGFCISFGSLEPLPDRRCLSSPPPRGSSFGVRRLWSKGVGGRPDSF